MALSHFAELASQHLAGGGAGQGVDEADLGRALEAAEMLSHVFRDLGE